MWELLAAIAAASLIWAYWRVYVPLLTGIVVGLILESGTTSPAGIVPAGLGLVGLAGGLAWHRTARDDD